MTMTDARWAERQPALTRVRLGTLRSCPTMTGLMVRAFAPFGITDTAHGNGPKYAGRPRRMQM